MKDNKHFKYLFAHGHSLFMVLGAALVLLVFSSTRAEQITANNQSVVTVFSYYSDEQGRMKRNQGTGIWISKKNLIITVAHVVSGAEAIFIRSNDGSLIQARFYKVSPAFDIALLQVEKSNDLDQLPFKPIHFAEPATPLTAVHFGGSYNQITSKIHIISEINIKPQHSLYVMDFKLLKGSSGGGVFFYDGSLAGLIIGSNSRKDHRAIVLCVSTISIIIDDLEDIFFTELSNKHEYNCDENINDKQEYFRQLESIKANYWNGSSPDLQDSISTFLNQYPDLDAPNILAAMIAAKQGNASQGYAQLVDFASRSTCPLVNFYLGKISAEYLGNEQAARFHYEKAMQQASNPLFISLLQQRIRLLNNSVLGE